uniref:Uncharacterized protein n=1 Tax=Picea glauca TaxID=3330 RepID=A0A101LUT2_PICGL|nr:hypothetical protein ABT39_MTgene2310 [Picea glauca]
MQCHRGLSNAYVRECSSVLSVRRMPGVGQRFSQKRNLSSPGNMGLGGLVGLVSP